MRHNEYEDIDAREFSTKELVEELRKREGVIATDIAPDEILRMEDGHGHIKGPAILLRVTD